VREAFCSGARRRLRRALSMGVLWRVRVAQGGTDVRMDGKRLEAAIDRVAD